MDKDINRILWLSMLSYGVPVYPLSKEDYVKYSNSNKSYSKVISRRLKEFKKVDFEKAEKQSYWTKYDGVIVERETVEMFLNDDIEIDWNKTLEPKENTEYFFDGTYSDDKEIPSLRGILILKNGNKYPWISLFNVNINELKNVLAFIKNIETQSEKQVIDKMKSKMKDALNSKMTGNFKFEIQREYNER